MCSQAGVYEIAFFVVSMSQTAVVEHFQFIADNKGDNIVSQTFLKHNQPANPAVAVLERMDRFKSNVKVNDFSSSDFSFLA